MRRVVITGLGTVNALGPDVKSAWPRILRGENGVKTIDQFDTDSLPVTIAASVDWDPAEMFHGPDFRKLDFFTMYALKAADEALADAGLTLSDEPEEARERYGSIIGTGVFVSLGIGAGIAGRHEACHFSRVRVSSHPWIVRNCYSESGLIRGDAAGGRAFAGIASGCRSSSTCWPMAVARRKSSSNTPATSRPTFRRASPTAPR